MSHTFKVNDQYFKVPDFRGRFPRGCDMNAGIDLDSNTRKIDGKLTNDSPFSTQDNSTWIGNIGVESGG